MKQQKYPPINICMNPKFTAKGINIYVLEELSQYHDQIYASDYQNLINQNLLYSSLKNIQSGMLFQLRKKLKVLVCICMYNQPRQALQLTLKGIYRNLKHFKEIGYTQNEIAVVLLQDGILKCDRSVIDFYQQLDAEQKNKVCVLKQRLAIIKEQIQNAKRQDREGKMVQNDNFPETIPKKLSLLYQNRWKPKNNQNEQGNQFLNCNQKLNLFSCFKHLNGKKLSSHAWFFQGFCRYLVPKYCILLDVGTVPDEYGVVNLIKGMQYDDKIGGVSGFMSIDSQFQSYEGGDQSQAQKSTKIIFSPQKKPLLNGKEKEGSGQNMISGKNNMSPQLELQNIKIRNSVVEDLPKQYMFDRQIKYLSVIQQEPEIQILQQQSCFKKFKQWITKHFFSVQKAQQVQYIYAHMLDKNTESWMGFLHVLPGAWSGYRLTALQTGQMFQKDLLQKKYFKTIINPQSEQGQGAYKFANMYLAEDRILSLGIYCQKQKDFYLKYIPNARAKTDPMKSHYDLITQRRRWINSSNFAFQYVFANYLYDFAQSAHGLYDLFNMRIGMVLAGLAFINSYLIPAFYLFVLYSTIRNIDYIQSQQTKDYIALFLSLIYTSVVVATIGGSLIGADWIKSMQEVATQYKSGKVKKKKVPANGPAIYITYILTAFTYTLLITISSMIASILQKGIVNIINGNTISVQTYMIFVLIIINIGSFVLILLVHVPTHPRQVWNIIKGYPSYLSYQGCYTHTMLIYSFCNVDDVSWGTKGAGEAGGKKYQTQKMFYISSWIFWNAVTCFIFFFIDFVLQINQRKFVLIAIAVYAGIILTIRVIFALLNHLKFYLCCCCGNPTKTIN